MTLRAPIDGIVIENATVTGIFYAKGETLPVIAPLDHLWVTPEVAKEDRAKVRVGQQCEVLHPIVGGPIRSVVDFISDGVAAPVRIALTIPNPGVRLKADMHVRVRLDATPGVGSPPGP